VVEPLPLSLTFDSAFYTYKVSTFSLFLPNHLTKKKCVK
jgi:hypothetical protein